MSTLIDWGVFRIYVGDCVAAMRQMPAESVDSCVTDPPYGIRFMGAAWDGADIETRTLARRAMPSRAPNAGPNGGHAGVAAEAGKYDLSPAGMLAFQQFSAEWAREAIRVLKPGGHLVSFASPRTYHRMVCGLEEAGFEIRDQLAWVFGSGFPKSHNGPWGGTALKPAYEPICLARKPPDGTVADNWARHNVGGLNIEACRVPTTESLNGGAYAKAGGRSESQSLYCGSGMNQPGKTTGLEFVQPSGRWPANLLHDGSDEVLAAFPDAPGQMADAKTTGGHKTVNVYSPMRRTRAGEPSSNNENFGSVGFKMRPGTPRADSSSSSARFFYCAKTSKSDRGPGNNHPTVKPTDLMRWLCRLITPAGGVILDPFLGSGSTGKAATSEGFTFIGCEKDPDYCKLAERRIATAVFGAAAFGSAA